MSMMESAPSLKKEIYVCGVYLILGSCQVSMTGDKKSVNAGKANAHLSYDSGVLTLQYSDGEICSKKNVPRITYINFVCQPGEGNGVPVFIDSSDDCLYYFDWHTQLACEKEVSEAQDLEKRKFSYLFCACSTMINSMEGPKVCQSNDDLEGCITLCILFKKKHPPVQVFLRRK